MTASARHVAIITDGNGRWARAARPAGDRGPPGRRRRGQGAPPRRRRARDRGAHRLLLLDRELVPPEEEVEGLMRMFGERIESETPELDEEGVRMRFIGRRDGRRRRSWPSAWPGPKRRPPPTSGSSSTSPSTTAAGRRSSTRREASRVSSEEEFRSHLYAPEMHDPDLLIRTSGEQRVSNYLLWQCAYSELVFRDELWPDFGRAALEESLARVRVAAAPLRSAERDGPLRRRDVRASRSERPRAAAAAQAPAPAARRGHAGRDGEAGPRRDPLDRLRDRDRRRRRRLLRGRDDRHRRPLPARVHRDDRGAAADPARRLHRRRRR